MIFGTTDAFPNDELCPIVFDENYPQMAQGEIVFPVEAKARYLIFGPGEVVEVEMDVPPDEPGDIISKGPDNVG